MDSDIFKIVLESLSSTAILALGFWFVITRVRNGRAKPDLTQQEYVTKTVFYAAVKEGRLLADQRHEAELTAISKLGDDFRESLNQTNQNHLDHVQHGHDD